MENIHTSQENDKGDFLFFILLILAVLVGSMIGTTLAVGIGFASGVNINEMMGDLDENSPIGIRNYIRTANGVSHLFTFTVPALIFAYFFYQRDWIKKLGLLNRTQSRSIGLGILFMLFAFPFVQLLFWLNRQIPLPEMLTNMEASAENMLKALLTMDSPVELLFNLFVVAVLPAVGEELLFRGLLQSRLERIWKNGVPAIWVSAIIFSAIHLQFEGFLPRLLLGATLGYLFYWTRSLWVPIIAHFFFNGMQVVGQYFFAEQMAELEKAENMDPNWLLGILSLGIIILLGNFIRKSANNSIL